MEFTLSNVQSGQCIFLEGARENYIKSRLYFDPNYVWTDDHWKYVSHMYLNYNPVTKSWVFYMVISDKGYLIEDNLHTNCVVNEVIRCCEGKRIVNMMIA